MGDNASKTAIQSAGISADKWLIESNLELEYLTEDKSKFLEQLRKSIDY